MRKSVEQLYRDYRKGVLIDHGKLLHILYRPSKKEKKYLKNIRLVFNICTAAVLLNYKLQRQEIENS